MSADDVDPLQKEDFRRGLSDMKIILMWDVWADDWGNREEFAKWALGLRDSLPPAGTEQAAEIFHAGLRE